MWSQLYFGNYVRFVHKWEPREHQKPWFAALQALGDGHLRRPQASVDCPNCTEFVGCCPKHITNRLLILAPPASGKTALAIEFAAWLIGRATLRGETPLMGYVSYSDEVSMGRSVAIRDTIYFNDRYKLVFPLAVPDKNKGWGQKEWYLQRSDPSIPFPTLRAAGVTGGILSFRFDTLTTLDDLHDGKNLTASTKDEVWRIYWQSIRTRGHEEAPMMGICTRFADDDWAGRVMRTSSDWHVNHVKALKDDGTSYWPFEPDIGRGISVEELLRLQKESPLAFVTQYQAMPPSSEGVVFKWWHFTPQMPHPSEVERVYQAWDTASTLGDQKSASYNVMVEGLKTKKGIFINRVYRERKAPAEISHDMVRLFQEAEAVWGKGKVLALVENKSSGGAFVSMLKSYSAIGPYIRPVNIRGMKGHSGQADLMTRSSDLMNRASASSLIFEAQSVWLPFDWTPWKEDYMTELSAYPHTTHTDQVAATVLLLEHVYPSRIVGPPPNIPVRIPGWTR